MTRKISSKDDVIDSREVIARIEELEQQAEYAADPDGVEDPLTDDEVRELAALSDLAAEAVNESEDWVHGATLIRHNYFVDYVREYVHDTEQIPKGPEWVVSHIDWDGVADELRPDYSDVTFDGVTYYVR